MAGQVEMDHSRMVFLRRGAWLYIREPGIQRFRSATSLVLAVGLVDSGYFDDVRCLHQSGNDNLARRAR